MAAKHGTRMRYVHGCHCEDCTEANRIYFRQRRAGGPSKDSPIGEFSGPQNPGPVEAGVESEIAGLSEARPGLAQTALALARLMDDPKAKNQQPAAAAKLADILDKLRKGTDSRKSKLASVRAMTSAKSTTS